MAACNFLQDDNAMCPICGIKLYILHPCGILSLCLYCIDRIDCRRGRPRWVRILVMVQVSRASIVLPMRRMTPKMKACGTEYKRPSRTVIARVLGCIWRAGRAPSWWRMKGLQLTMKLRGWSRHKTLWDLHLPTWLQTWEPKYLIFLPSGD